MSNEQLQIMSCDDGMMWYANHIGEVFDIEKTYLHDNCFMVRTPSGFLNRVNFADCVVIHPNEKRPDIATLVKEDIEQRVQQGEREYGERLKPHNGRDALQDIYEELADALLYIKQLQIERDSQ